MRKHSWIALKHEVHAVADVESVLEVVVGVSSVEFFHGENVLHATFQVEFGGFHYL